MLNKYCNLCKITLVLYAVCLGWHLGDGIVMTDYISTPLNEQIFSVCEDYPDKVASNMIDLSNISVIYQDDETILMTGTVEFVMDLEPDEKIFFHAQPFIKRRGQWVNVIYSFHKNDFCAALCDPTEIWYIWTKNIESCLKGSKRICPPAAGTVVEYNSLMDAKMSFPNRNMDGDYKVKITLGSVTNEEKFICFNIFFRLDKV